MEEASGDIGAFLKCVDLFQDLDDTEVAALIVKAKEERHEDKSFIFKEREMGDAMFVVLDGTVKIVKMVAGSKFKTLIAMGVGDFFGEMALLSDEPRSATIIAEEDTDCFVLFKGHFKHLVERNSAFAQLVERAREKRSFEIHKV